MARSRRQLNEDSIGEWTADDHSANIIFLIGQADDNVLNDVAAKVITNAGEGEVAELFEYFPEVDATRQEAARALGNLLGAVAAAINS